MEMARCDTIDSHETWELTAEDFPSGIGALGDPPKELYVRGRLPEGPMVAIVGSRKADPRYLRFAADLAGELAAGGFVVLSGGAAGVDTAAHRGALEAGGQTVAVLGSGFDHVYPKCNEKLFGEIPGRGALITEFAPAVPPSKWTFPRRNRLVAAMACAVVVIQAASRSGALITARIARELGIPVGAVPGSPFDPLSRGCNDWLRSGGVVVTGRGDVEKMIEGVGSQKQLNLPTIASRGMEATANGPVGLSQDEEIVWRLAGSSPLHVDEITNLAGLEVSRTTAALLKLELSGFIVDQGGKWFVRTM